ncbi:MAG TPA: trypsin-like serine protease [Beijerinckiaceae bacterium]
MSVNASWVWAQPSQVMSPPGQQGAGQAQIVDGKAQEEADWPSTLRFLVNNQFYCTSTIVGERVILTAAHCLVPGTPMKVDLGAGQAFNLTCELHPHYRRFDLYADIALCVSDRTLPRSRIIGTQRVAFSYENLDLRITRMRSGAELFLLGYGCRVYPQTSATAASDTSGQLYGGIGRVVRVPVEAGRHITTSGQAGICPGDSGGAAYALSDIGTLKGPRSIVAINSGYVPENKISDLTALFGHISQFIRDWSDDHGVKICGIHPEAQNCGLPYSK